MIGTTEVRWFMDGDCPRAVALWFDRMGEAVPVEERTDYYLRPPADASVGVKLREGRLEIKRRTHLFGPLSFARSEGVIDSWRKWSFELLSGVDHDAMPEWIAVHKRRKQRIVLQARAGVVVTMELGESTTEPSGSVDVWTICFESAGPDIPERDAALTEACRLVLSHPDAPPLLKTHSLSYPEWLLGGAKSSV